jgi:hypothetical protein
MLDVYKFNQTRNEFVLNEDLEWAMLKEEVAEFYEAESLAERIDAMVDVRYVFEGTQMKYNKAGKEFPEDMNRWIGQFHRLSTTIVAEELGDNSQFMEKILNKAWKIVCEINATKPTDKDDMGKVVKFAQTRNATKEIAEMIKGMIGGEDSTENDS